MTQKIVYQYDSAGCYVGPTMADASPLEDGVWHMPARTTAVAPPADHPADRWPRWNGAAWELTSKPSLAANDNDPVAKLQAFLAANPDVAAIL